MDASGIVVLVILSLFYISMTNQAATSKAKFECPLEDHPKYENGTVEHNVTRTVRCFNGRNMPGCCVPRQYCDFNTSHTDLSLYGPPGYRMTCKDVCCPQDYILPIPLPPNKTEIAAAEPTKSSTTDEDDDASMDPDDNIVD